LVTIGYVEGIATAGKVFVEQLIISGKVEVVAPAGKVFFELCVLITAGNVEVVVSAGRELVEQLLTVGNIPGMATTGKVFVELLIIAGKVEVPVPAGKVVIEQLITAGNVRGKATVDRELVEVATVGKLLVDGGNCTSDSCVLVCSLFTTCLGNIRFMDASRLTVVRVAFDLQDNPIKKVHKIFKSALNFIHLYDDALSRLALE